MAYSTRHATFVAEADLGLGGVDVDIDLFVFKVDIEGGYGVAAGRQLPFVSIDNGEDERAALDPAAIDEHGDGRAVSPVNARGTGQAGHTRGSLMVVDGEHGGGGGSVVDGGKGVTQVVVAAGGEHPASARNELEGDLRVGERIV